ncbi:L1 [Leptonychotes weddellii papillomavirus 3]|uniref:Major capsid protein L1 n=1 Tax=Leptonychotes weddellii papillomavirus 3 TaxID=2077304 RepID=A0A2I8B2Q4_9PAPI|nr:L1 [Leptonychotes weddellii papillomavirus 3]AUT11916.1 L1 [Leptonychotes weddellii papillomavirus 3]
MALWRSNSQKLFLPPNPVAKVLGTDVYVQRLNHYYHAETKRLLTVGHPYFEMKNGNGEAEKITVPKVSGNQYRVFRAKLPDPNAFAFSDGAVYNPESQRLVWACVGLEVSRGQPLGAGLSGHPLLNRFHDAENPSSYNQGTYEGDNRTDDRQNVAFDVKQTQLLIVGCRPATGEHWHKSLPCAGEGGPVGRCPGIELRNTVIQDGDMCDIGFGAMDFAHLQENKSEVPLDIAGTICKYPDYIKMSKEATGDSLFFFARREQMYIRHFFTRAGFDGEKVPGNLFLAAKNNQRQDKIGSATYFGSPSGSLVSSDAQLFNRPYWIRKAQGLNNGICWENQLFVTVVDNTRGTNLSISMSTQIGNAENYEDAKFKEYLRHAEEYELTFIFQLCRVDLTPDIVGHIHTMNPRILEGWNLGLQVPTSSILEDKYRYISSLATKCPVDNPPKPPEDPWAEYSFWSIDLTESLSSDLDQFPLGRKFLAQISTRTSLSRKRPAARTKAPPSKKRKR